MRHHAFALLLTTALLGCTGDEPVSQASPVGSALPPRQPALPEGLDTGGAVFVSLDTTTSDLPAPLHGAPPGYLLIGHLSSPGGEREILLVPGVGATAVTVAPGGWNLFAVGAFAADGRGLLCWNILVGPESAPGAMPHPSTGLAITCRRWAVGVLGPVLNASGDAAPSWLQDVVARSQGGFELAYYRDQSGWLFGTPEAGDGVYLRVDNGVSLTPPQLLEPAQLP